MILITGATGFIGSAVLDRLTSDLVPFKILTRRKVKHIPEENVIYSDLESLEYLNVNLFNGVHSVIHCASIAHNLNIRPRDALAEYRKVNRDATIALARLMAENGAKRFIFLSSVKVNGESTDLTLPFNEISSNNPTDPYGVSKLETELGLLDVARLTGMEVVIVRPPLVYGPGVKGNFALIINWVIKGIPLPFGRVSNKRSFIAIENLVDFIMLCVDRNKSTKAANEIFLISDGEDVSTKVLLHKVAEAYSVSPNLLPVPVFLMRLVAALIGKTSVTNRLFNNLQIDSGKAYNLLGWSPVITMDEQLKKMADYDHNISNNQ